MFDYPPAVQFTDFTDAVEAPPVVNVPLVVPVARRFFAAPRFNPLQTATCGVEDLWVQANVTGKKSRLSYARNPQHPQIRSGSAEKRFHFAPGTEMLTIRWDFKGRERVREAKLELYVRNNAAPVWTKFLRWDPAQAVAICPKNPGTQFDGSMNPAGVLAGQHEEVIANFNANDFPDGCLTIDQSPYKLKLTITQADAPVTKVARFLYLDVLVNSIELEWGPLTALAASPTLDTPAVPRDELVYDSLRRLDGDTIDNLTGNLPAPGETKKVFLLLDTFYTAVADLMTNSAYTRHRTAWGDGPNIPIFATVKIRNSNDQSVDAPLAIGKADFLWDWQDECQDAPGAKPGDWAGDRNPSEAANRDFLGKALDFDRTTTLPPGRNCHAERGGKRGPNAPPVFPLDADPGTDAPANGIFPFEVHRTGIAQRTWAALSRARRAGNNAGKTGVRFQPSRMAGDAYSLAVCFKYPGFTLDTTATAGTSPLNDVPPELLARTGIFEIWRELRIVKYLRKGNPAAVDWTAVQTYFNAAFVRIRPMPVAQARAPVAQALYNTSVTNAIALAAIPWFIGEALSPPAGGGARDFFTDAGDDAIAFQSHTNFVANVIPQFGAGFHPTLINYLANPGRETDEFSGNYLLEQAMVDAENDWTGLSGLKVTWPRLVLRYALFNYFNPLTARGIFLFQAREIFKSVGTAWTGVNGWGGYFDNMHDHHQLILLVGAGRDETLAHELGHCLGLNHVTVLEDPNLLHQQGISKACCLMSYFNARSLCGACMVRMRGWSLEEIDPATGLPVIPMARTIQQDPNVNHRP